MVQSFNLQGVMFALRVLFQPSLALPHFRATDIREIDFALLSEKGIKGLAFDKDNCLTAPYQLQLHPPFQPALQKCKDIFGDNIVIVSNSAGTDDDKDHREAAKIEESLGVHVLRHSKKKPAGGEQLTAHFEAKGIEPTKIVFIGDRALTDVVFGNLHGMLTIQTGIITEKGDNFLASRIRLMENFVFGMLSRAGLAPPAHYLRSQNGIIKKAGNLEELNKLE